MVVIQQNHTLHNFCLSLKIAMIYFKSAMSTGVLTAFKSKTLRLGPPIEHSGNKHPPPPPHFCQK